MKYTNVNTSLLIGLFVAGILAYRRSAFIQKKIQKVLLGGGFMVFLLTFLFGVNVNPFLALLFIGFYDLFEELRMISIHTVIQSVVRGKAFGKGICRKHVTLPIDGPSFEE